MTANPSHKNASLLEVLEEIEESKKHLKIATKEILLAAKAISKIVLFLSVDPDFNQNYPKLGQLLQLGIQTISHITEQIDVEKKDVKKIRVKPNGKTRKRKKS